MASGSPWGLYELTDADLGWLASFRNVEGGDDASRRDKYVA